MELEGYAGHLWLNFLEYSNPETRCPFCLHLMSTNLCFAFSVKKNKSLLVRTLSEAFGIESFEDSVA